MGEDWECGCRYSMGHWFLCEKHERLMLETLAEDGEEISLLVDKLEYDDRKN